MSFEGKVAIVTGGARNIGRGIALVLARRGANIVIADIDEEAAKQTADEIAALGVQSMACQIDVTKRDSVQRAVGRVLERFGQIDILVNNAGVVGNPGWYEHETLREEDWDFCYQVNVKGMVITSEVVAEHMKQRRSGKIVNISSVAGRQGRPAIAHYSASKAAALNYSQALALQLAPYDINVNTVCPGILWTAMWEVVGLRYAFTNWPDEKLTAREAFDRSIEQRVPLGREQTPEDIGNAVAFFASDDAVNITGQSLNVDGGNFLN
jgi:meso-butanediol dehydrogenase/(S,S)-butanediol dehydrogenase/diacetyl reductase